MMVKYKVASVLVAGTMAVSIALVGCGGQQAAPAAQQAPAQEQTTTETQKQTETTKTETTQTQQQPETTQAQPQAQTQTQTQVQADVIGEEEAKRIAFEDAGVAEQDATLIKAELDIDDGVTKYEVDFHVGQTEYEYDIDATTGAIISRSMDMDD